VFVTYLFLGGTWAWAAGPDETSPVPNPEVSFALVQSAIEKSGGKLSPEARAAYVDWSELTILRKLSAEGKTIPADCMAEVQGDSTLQDAMFAATDPPDPSILENYARLRSALGAPFTARYRALVIADAVATRANGARQKSDPGLKGEAPAPMPDGAAGQAPDPLVEGIVSYMKQSGVTTLELFDDQQAQQKLAAFLQQEKVGAGVIAEINDQSAFHDALKGALVALGQRPAYRDPPPDDAAWLRYLASVYEATPSPAQPTESGKPVTWPLFPMGRAPWPLLMPLHHAYPLREALYIWEKYEGLHGPERYHTYGPYKKERGGEWDLELQPSIWHWDAWPDLIVHGGVCTTIAPMSVETHVTLCQPAVMAGQPGHSNLISFRNADGYWFGSVEQAYAGGPDVTQGSWLFNEIGTAPGLGSQHDRPWAVAEYHLGLALAMNLGLARYIDTRIAVSIYHHLPESDLGTIGTALLTQATQINPYNPAPWYLLGQQTSSFGEGISLVKLAMDKAAAMEASGTGDGGDLSGVQSSAPRPVPKPVEAAVYAYWNVIEEHLTGQTVLNRPVPRDKAVAQTILDFVKTVPGISDAQEVPYVLVTEGSEAEETKLEYVIQQHLEGAKYLDKKGAEKRFAAELKTFVHTASKDDGDELLSRLKTILPPMPADDPYLLIVDAVKPKNN